LSFLGEFPLLGILRHWLTHQQLTYHFLIHIKVSNNKAVIEFS
jgi:hypothetical protein